jgi:hypothetical protein
MSNLFSPSLSSRRGRISLSRQKRHGPKQLHAAKEFAGGSVPYDRGQRDGGYTRRGAQ